MPERKRISTVPSPDVQGDDSWVKVAQFTVGEYTDLQERGEQEGADMWALEADALSTHVIDWNWVDDDGKPMPLPTPKNPAPLKLLTRDETLFLVNALIGGITKEALKNSNSN